MIGLSLCVGSETKGASSRGAALPVPQLARSRSAQVFHCTHLLHPSSEAVPQPSVCHVGPLQCRGGPDRGLHPPGLHVGEDCLREQCERLRVPDENEAAEDPSCPDPGLLEREERG